MRLRLPSRSSGQMPELEADVVGNLVSKAMDAAVVPGFSRIGYAVRSRTREWPDPSRADLSGRVVVVTGPTSGLGLETIRILASTGARLVLVARNLDKCRAVVGEMRPHLAGPEPEIVVADMADLVAVRRASDEIVARYGAIHALVHNAGALLGTRETSPQGIEMTVACHVLGPHLMTTLLMPALRAAAGRVITVSSGGMYAVPVPECGDDRSPEMDGAGWNGTRQYAIAKRAQIVMNAEWARRERGVTFAVMHPGWADTPGVASSIPAFRAVTSLVLRTPRQGADTIAWLVATSDALPSGKFWCDRDTVPEHRLPTTRRSDTAARRDALWAWCEAAIAAYRA